MVDNLDDITLVVVVVSGPDCGALGFEGGVATQADKLGDRGESGPGAGVGIGQFKHPAIISGNMG